MPINQSLQRNTAALFDVDGTIVKCTVAHYYVWLCLAMLHPGFVTGAINFIVQPLAEFLQCYHVFSVQLHEEDGNFTGELTTPPLSVEEKARVIREFAKQLGVDVASSYRYGDSPADLRMLRTVNQAVAVDPGNAFRRIALESRWEIQDWTLRVKS